MDCMVRFNSVGWIYLKKYVEADVIAKKPLTKQPQLINPIKKIKTKKILKILLKKQNFISSPS